MKNKIKELFIAFVTSISRIIGVLFVLWVVPFTILTVLPILIFAFMLMIILPFLAVISKSVREEVGHILQSDLITLPKDVINGILDWF